ncbi:MAG: zinc-ribbon domain-containing protein [Candidatus Binatia bacterium]
MLVQCPKCKTTYKVSDDTVKGTAPAFRCSRCKHTFEIQLPTESAPDPGNTGATGSGEDSELAFTFETATRAEPESAKEEGTRSNEPPYATTPHSQNLDGGDTRPNAQDSVRTPDADVPLGAPVEEQPYRIGQPRRETTDNVLEIAPYRDQRASVMPFLTLFGLLITFAAFALAYQRNHPIASEGWVASIPLLGPSVVRNDHLKNGILLKSVETKFQILQGNREVVVLTGVAVNQNPVMIRNVQLSGQLFDHEGKEIERQTMWIGNAISLQIIRGMTAQDVTDLQRLKPLKSFEIPPGDSVPFAIVFLRASKGIKNARCEVLSAEGV